MADPRVAVGMALLEAIRYGNVDGVREALDSQYGPDLLECRLVRSRRSSARRPSAARRRSARVRPAGVARGAATCALPLLLLRARA